MKLKVFSRPMLGSFSTTGGGFSITPKRNGHEDNHFKNNILFSTHLLYSIHTLAGSHGKVVSWCTDTLIETRLIGTHSVV